MWILIPAAYVTNLMTFMNKNCKFKTSNCHVIREEGGADAGISSNRNRIEVLFFSNLEFVLWKFWFNKKISQHCCCEDILIQKISSEHFIDREDYRYHESIKIHWNWNHNSSPFGGPVVHRHKNPPNWAELAVWPRWHLQKGLRYNFNSNEFWYSHGIFSLLCQWNAQNFFFVSVRLRNNSEKNCYFLVIHRSRWIGPHCSVKYLCIGIINWMLFYVDIAASLCCTNS